MGNYSTRLPDITAVYNISVNETRSGETALKSITRQIGPLCKCPCPYHTQINNINSIIICCYSARNGAARSRQRTKRNEKPEKLRIINRVFCFVFLLLLLFGASSSLCVCLKNRFGFRTTRS